MHASLPMYIHVMKRYYHWSNSSKRIKTKKKTCNVTLFVFPFYALMHTHRVHIQCVARVHCRIQLLTVWLCCFWMLASRQNIYLWIMVCSKQIIKDEKSQKKKNLFFPKPCLQLSITIICGKTFFSIFYVFLLSFVHYIALHVSKIFVVEVVCM